MTDDRRPMTDGTAWRAPVCGLGPVFRAAPTFRFAAGLRWGLTSLALAGLLAAGCASGGAMSSGSSRTAATGPATAAGSASGAAATAVSSVTPAGPTGAANASTGPVVGPARGWLVVVGGGRLGLDILNRFVELAGGPDARIVVIPTNGTQDRFTDEYSAFRMLRRAGARHLSILNTRNRTVADRERFVAPLDSATGVWIPGGRQWRMADAYLYTRTQRALQALLDRGGVIGGSSAGASIQASYLVRGAPQGNTIMMAPGHEEGFGFLRNTAVDQHLLTRGRQNDMLQVIKAHPDLLGIGLDEGTAIVVHGDTATVLGRSKVAFYNTAQPGGSPYFFLSSGGVFDLATRKVISGTVEPPR
jgi:cyanophycinase